MLEDVLVDIRTALRTNIAAAFNVQDAAFAAADVTEFGVALTLDDVATGSYIMGEIDTPPRELPAIFLLARGTESIPYFTAETQLRHNIDVGIIVCDHDPEKVARRLYRSIEAMRRVLTQYVEHDGTNNVFQVDLQNVAYFETVDLGTGSGFRRTKFGVITALFDERETRP